jgi:hypothetical protein
VTRIVTLIPGSVRLAARRRVHVGVAVAPDERHRALARAGGRDGLLKAARTASVARRPRPEQTNEKPASTR